MNIHITFRRIPHSQELKDFTIQKISKLGKFYEGILSCEVILSEEKNPKRPKRAEIMIRVYRSTMKGISRSDTLQKAIGEAAGKIERQLKKYKSKLRQRHKAQRRETAMAA